MAERPIPAAPVRAEPIRVEPIAADAVPVAAYAVPPERPRMRWGWAALVGVAGAALGLVFAFIAFAMTAPTGRLPLPRDVALPLLFPLPSIWWSAVGPLAGPGVNTVVGVGQFPAYGFVIGLFAARGHIRRAAAAVLLVHAAAYAVCRAFALP